MADAASAGYFGLVPRYWRILKRIGAVFGVLTSAYSAFVLTIPKISVSPDVNGRMTSFQNFQFKNEGHTRIFAIKLTCYLLHDPKAIGDGIIGYMDAGESVTRECPCIPHGKLLKIKVEYRWPVFAVSGRSRFYFQDQTQADGACYSIPQGSHYSDNAE